MKLLSLSLRGAIGIDRGLGVEQIDIDFTQFDAGLVALVAPNGSGKSTILENLHPYRTLASRSGALQQHFYLRDSHRDLRFEMGGHAYRCVLLIDGVRGKQESYLYRDNTPLNDGKTPSYDAAVRHLFGSEDMFFRSLFRAQNAQSIADLTAGKRKDFFVELLGLARIAEYHEQAKARARAIEDRLAGDRARIGVLQEQAAGTEAAGAAMERYEAEAAQIRANITAAETKVTELHDKITKARTDFARFDADETALDAARNRVKEHAGRVKTLQTQLDTYGAQINAAAARCLAEKGEAERAFVAITNDATAKRDRAEKIAANRTAILKGIDALDGLREVVADFDNEQAQNWEHQEALTKLERQIAAQESELRLWESKREAMERTIASLEETAALTGAVPCAGTDLQPGCKLLGRANEAAAQAARGRDEYAAYLKTRPVYDITAESSADAIRGQLAELGYDAAGHEAARKALREHEAKNWHGLLAEADAAADTVAECNARINEGGEALDRAISAADTRLKAENERIAGELARARESLEEARQSQLAAEVEVTALETRVLSRSKVALEITELENAAGYQNMRLRDMRAELENAVRTISDSRARVEACTTAMREAEAIETRLAPDARELEEWLLLARATGKDGVQALELDAAGPGVAAIANELLADTFGSGFQIAFETTRPSADGKTMLEVFDIRVTTEDGEQALENLSGGQRVWTEAALSQAVAIYLRRKSGLDLRTSFLDEADGALDTDNAWHYLAMLRASHDLAGTHHTFLITHRRELLSHIPQQIRLVSGVGIEVQA